MLYVISDIHSHYEPMILALEEKGFFENRQNKLLVLGDALDRGPDAKRVVEFLLSLHNEGRLIYVKGNHENLFIECIEDIIDGGMLEIICGVSHHYMNGTFSTLLQIAGMSENEAFENPYELVERIKRSDYYKVLLPSCVNFYENEKYVFTHGFMPVIRKYDVTEGDDNIYKYNEKWREADDAVWRDAVWLNGIEMVCRYHVTEPNKTVVVGHISASRGHKWFGNNSKDENDFSIFAYEGLLAIDAGTVISGKVNCLALE